MSDSNASGRCRRGRLPGTLILNWQSAETRAARPLVRKPVTACEACRLAKVRCDAAQPDCVRCRNRGSQCLYSFRAVTDAPTVPIVTPPSSTSRDSPSRTVPLAHSPDQTTMNPPMDSDPSSSADGTAAAIDITDWGEAASNYGLDDIHWVFPEASFNTSISDDQSQLHMMHPSQSPEQVNLPSEDDHPNLSTLAQTNKAYLEFPSHSPWMTCPCRVNLISHVPRLESVMQEKPTPRLDEVLKVTEDVIQSCQAIVTCTQCKIAPVDIVSILSVFQQTTSCFNHIVNSSVDGTIKLDMGGYKVNLMGDILFKRLLIVNLVRQANAMLDSLTSLGQGQFLSPQTQTRIHRSPACLNQLNMSYLQEVVDSFKGFFRLITDASEDIELK